MIHRFPCHPAAGQLAYRPVSTPQPPRPEPTRGLADELFGATDDPGATGPIRRIEPEAPTVHGRPVRDARHVPPAGPPARRRTASVDDRRILLVAGTVVLALLAAAAVVWVVNRGDGQDRAGTPSVTPTAPPPPYELVERATRPDTDCAAHAYGEVADFFAGTPCASLGRALHTGSVDGAGIVVAVATVTMASEADATALQELVDTSGTGNVNDLLREGVTIPDVPERLTDAGYASQRTGAVVVIVETDFTDPDVEDEAALDAVADGSLVLGG